MGWLILPCLNDSRFEACSYQRHPIRHTIFERPVVVPLCVDRRLSRGAVDKGEQLSFGWEVLEDTMKRPVAEPSALIGIALRVLFRDWRGTATNETIVQQHHLGARREHAVETGEKLRLPIERNVGKPEPSKSRTERLLASGQCVRIADAERNVACWHSGLGDRQSFGRRVDRDDSRDYRSQELRPVPRAARDFEDNPTRQRPRQPLLDLPQIRLALRFVVIRVVLAGASRVVRLQRRETTFPLDLTFDMSTSGRQAKPAGGRPLDGRVRRLASPRHTNPTRRG